MAKGSETRLYVAAVVLAGLGGAFYLQKKDAQADRAAHVLGAADKDLPKFNFTEEASGKVTKLVIEKPATEGDHPEPAAKHVLVKAGETWKLAEPVGALANQANVKSLLTSLAKLEVKELLTPGTGAYGSYELTDDKALHFQAYEGDKVVLEFWTGKSGGRGQMARLAGRDGVYGIDGFSKFTFARDTKGWRDLKIVEVDTDAATEVSVVSEVGAFAFKKDKGAWTGKFKKAKASSLLAIKDFDPAKVDDLLRSYKTLNATGFGDAKSLEEAGLKTPLATLVIKGTAGETRIDFGANSEGSARWAIAHGNEQIFSIGSWAADWAFAEEAKFQKKKEEAVPAEPELPVGE